MFELSQEAMDRMCLTIASNGWRKASKKTMKGDHADHIHGNCDCEFAIRFDGKSTVEGYDPDALREQYDNAEGITWKEKVNFMRREQYKASGDKIRAQRRTAYARKHAKNEARAIDSMHVGSNEDITYSREDYLKELQTSLVGIDTIRHIRDSKVTILIEEDHGDNGIRGW